LISLEIIPNQLPQAGLSLSNKAFSRNRI